MNGLLWAAAGTGFTFSMTTLGAAVVFFMRKEGQSEKVQKAFLGFAAGVMIAASVWSLLIPAINEAEALGRIGWIPAAGGFALGVLFLMGLDKAMPYFLPEPGREEGVRRGLKLLYHFLIAAQLGGMISTDALMPIRSRIFIKRIAG